MKGPSPPRVARRVGNGTIGGLIMWPALHMAQITALVYAYSIRPEPEALSVALCRLLLLLVLELISGILFSHAFRSDPGYLDNLEELSRLEVSRAGSRARWCTICSLHQPIRSRHCHHCNRCVARYDHHCHFLSTCIGQENYASFFTFIAYETILDACATVSLIMATTQLKVQIKRQHVAQTCVVMCALCTLVYVCVCVCELLYRFRTATQTCVSNFHRKKVPDFASTTTHPRSFFFLLFFLLLRVDRRPGHHSLHHRCSS